MSKIYPSQTHPKKITTLPKNTHILNNTTQEDNPTQLYLKESDKSNYPNYPEKSSRGPRADDSRAKWWKGAGSLPDLGRWQNLKGKQPTFFGDLEGWWGGFEMLGTDDKFTSHDEHHVDLDECERFSLT